MHWDSKQDVSDVRGDYGACLCREALSKKLISNQQQKNKTHEMFNGSRNNHPTVLIILIALSVLGWGASTKHVLYGKLRNELGAISRLNSSLAIIFRLIYRCTNLSPT
jgi:hypothetical protein